MDRKMKITIFVMLAICLFAILTDFTLAQFNKEPIFAAPKVFYKDGGSTEYYGLGYKVIKYVEFSAEEGAIILDVQFGPWWMKFTHPNEFKSNNFHKL